MSEDELEEVAANVRVLIDQEMDVQHRLGGHPQPAPECPACQARTACSTLAAPVNRGGGRP